MSLFPGETAKVTLTMRRMNSFAGAVTFQLSPMGGVEFPETVTLPQEKSSVEFTVKASDDPQPRRQGINIHATGEVNGFEEELRGQPIEIEVKKIEPPKKK